MIIIPFASIEQHGPHLPLDVDLRLAREVCVRAARRNPNCLVMTPMAFGFEPHHMAWPGTIDIDWDVLIRYGVCVVSSLARHGFRRILIINGHGSNRPIMEMIVRLAQVRHPEIICAGQSWFALGAVAAAFQPLQESNHTSHACELETSAYLALDPDLVDMSQAAPDYSFRRSPHFWADLTGKKPDPDSRSRWSRWSISRPAPIPGARRSLQGERGEGRSGARGRGRRGGGDRRGAARARSSRRPIITRPPSRRSNATRPPPAAADPRDERRNSNHALRKERVADARG